MKQSFDTLNDALERVCLVHKQLGYTVPIHPEQTVPEVETGKDILETLIKEVSELVDLSGYDAYSDKDEAFVKHNIESMVHQLKQIK